MDVFLITYDLNNPGQNYAQLIKKIKSYPDWAKISDSSWCVWSAAQSTSIRDSLKVYLDQNDKLLVAKLSGQAAWSGLSSDVSNWLHDNL